MNFRMSVCPSAVVIFLTVAAVGQTKPSNAFIENRGQWDARAEFLTTVPHLNFWLTSEGAVFDFHRTDRAGIRTGDVVRASFINSNPAALAGVGEEEGKLNFFRDNTRATGVRMFEEVRAQRIYPGITARYYFDSGEPRYDLLIAPGADLSHVAMTFDGADGVRINEQGDLQIQTALGPVEEKGLRAYQEEGVLRIPVSCQMVMVDDRTVRFQAGPYDHNQSLVIDPLIFSTFLGGSDASGTDYGFGDTANAVRLDGSGNVIVAGTTYSSDFPVTTGAYQTTNPATSCSFVSKLSADGANLLWSTYLGGSGGASANAMRLDSSFNPIVAGSAGANFPTTAGVFQRALMGTANAFVAKLSANGAHLLWSTYLGGSGKDSANALALNGDAPVLAGTAYSANFPTTLLAYQSTNKAFVNSEANVFVAFLSADGAHLTASTYVGGTGKSNGTGYPQYHGDEALALVLDKAGNAVLAGRSSSSDFPVTANAYQSANRGVLNAFVARVSSDAKTLLSSTYIGGTVPQIAYQGDSATAVGLDGYGNSVVAGYAYSSNFPTTAGAFQSKGQSDLNRQDNAFVSIISPDATQLLASTYLGGLGNLHNGGDAAQAVVINPAGQIIVSGGTWSLNFPTTLGAFQTKKVHYNNYNAFVSKLTPNLTTLLYSTYIGGTKDDIEIGYFGDVANAMALDPRGNVVAAGLTSDPDYPITKGAYQTVSKGALENSSNAFVTKFSTDVAPSLRGLGFVNQRVAGGNVGQGIVFLNAVAQSPAGVSLASADSSLAHIPIATFVQPGSSQALFNIFTPVVTSQKTVLLTASYKGGTVTGTVVIYPLQVASITLTRSSIVGGNYQIGYVTLNGPAPAAGKSVTLSSTNTAAAQVPAAVMVPSGQTMVSFKLTTSPVSMDASLYVLGTLGPVTRNAKFTVESAHLVTALPVPGTIIGGKAAGVKIYLDGLAGPRGDVVQLVSSDPDILSVPATTIVPAGQKVFTANVISTKMVTGSNKVTLTVTCNGVNAVVNYTVVP